MNFEKIHIDRSTPVPLYFQLKSAIIDAIQSGELKPGDMLPTETEFSDMFGLSRTTIRQAIGELVMENRLYRIKSKGTFVSKPKILQGFMQNIESFTEQMRLMNLTPRTEVLKLEMLTPPKEVMEAFDLQPKDKVVHIFRRRFANEEPILLVENYLVSDCVHILGEDLETQGLYATIFKNPKTQISRFIRQIEAVSAGEHESRLLNVKIGHPIQLATSIGYNKNGRAIDYGIVRYRGDKNKFIVEFNVTI